MRVVALSRMRFWGFGFPSPDIRSKTAKLIHDIQCAMSIVYGRLDFSAMTNNAFIPEEASNFLVIESGDFIEVKMSERFPEVFALAKDRQPGESGLEALKADLFEEPEIVGDGAAPFFVVVGLVVRVIASPPTACDTIVACVQ